MRRRRSLRGDSLAPPGMTAGASKKRAAASTQENCWIGQARLSRHWSPRSELEEARRERLFNVLCKRDAVTFSQFGPVVRSMGMDNMKHPTTSPPGTLRNLPDVIIIARRQLLPSSLVVELLGINIKVLARHAATYGYIERIETNRPAAAPLLGRRRPRQTPALCSPRPDALN